MFAVVADIYLHSVYSDFVWSALFCH